MQQNLQVEALPQGLPPRSTRKPVKTIKDRPLRSARPRQRRAFHRVNQNQNHDHHGPQDRQENYHNHDHGYQQSQHAPQQLHPDPTEQQIQDADPMRSERLPRRGNYPGYAIYRYRNQIARQQEKWKRSGITKGTDALSPSKFGERNQQGSNTADDSADPFSVGSVSKGGKNRKSASARPSQATPAKGKASQDRPDLQPAKPRSILHNSRVRGADLYVVRLTRKGLLGCSMPCWRCLEWCKWAGIKRIFHWVADDHGDDNDEMKSGTKGGKEDKGRVVQSGRWECVKVNEARPEDCYSTQADGKILGVY